MATLTGKIVADFTTSLAAALAVGATSGTLQSATDDDGVALPSGRYFFTIDGSNSSKEHISCSLSGTALTSIKSVSRQGVETSGTVRAHRLGATVTITDFAHILQINNLVNGTTDLDSSDPLKYDGTATISDNNALATKAYVDGVAIAGSPDSSTSVKGIGRVSVAPASAATPIFVGDNDPRVPTQDENNALVGTSGTPSTSNKFVTNDDTTGTGSLLRLSALGGEIYEKTFTAGENITAGQPLHYSEYAQLNPITVDASTSAHSFSVGATHNLSVTIANQSNRLLIVDLECDGGATISSVTYNGVSMTLIDSQAAPASGNIVRSYRLIAPTVGTANVTVTTSGGSIPSFGLAIMATSYYNVDQTTPVEATAKSSTSGGGTFSHSISTLTAGALVHAAYAFNGTSGTSTITFDSVSGLNAINIASSFGAAKARSPVSETVQSVTVDNTHSASANRAVLLLAIKPSEAQSPRVQKASATAATAFVEVKQNFVGFAKETITAGNAIKVQTGGIITGLSGLSIGKYYYIQDTAGNLGLSAGTVSKIACKAISATSAVIAI